MGYASLCILSYERLDFVLESIKSARDNADYPCEIVVHDDGSSVELQRHLHAQLACGLISRLVMNPPGRNEGVGAALNRAAGVATGDPIVKLDQDLLYCPGWLRKVVDLLEADTSLGAVGLFKYPVDPVDWRKMELGPGELVGSGTCVDYHYVIDFVGSAIAVPRGYYEEYGPWPEHSAAFAEDVEFKLRLREEGGLDLALPDEDLAHNRGFGIGPSTVVVAPGQVRAICEESLIFGC